MLKKNSKKAITSNSNTTELKTTPSVTKKQPLVIDEYLDMYSFQKKPVTDNFLKMLADRYVKWVKEETKCILFTQFLEAQGINRTDFYRWLLRSDQLKDAHEFVIMMLCNRREVGVATRKYEPTMMSKMHGHYSDIWVTETARIAALSNTEQKTGNITVVIPPFRETSE